MKDGGIITRRGEATPRGDGSPLGEDIKAVVDRTTCPTVFLEAGSRIRYANPAAGWLFGRPPSSLEGLDVLTLVHGGDRLRARSDLQQVADGRDLVEPVEYRVRAADGTWRTVRAIASNLLGLTWASGILVSAMDVTEQRAVERSLRDLLHRDPITGLPNRRALGEHLDRLTAPGTGVAFVAIDHFKRINDSLGHTVGDLVLQAVAERIQTLVPAHGTVAHFGADTFVVVLPAMAESRATLLGWELIARLSSPMFVAGQELRLSASVGLAMADEASTRESILRDADAALTRSKSIRRGGVEVFSEAMRSEMLERLSLEADLRGAIDRSELQVHFQPVVRLSDSQLEGAEALLRWNRPNGVAADPATVVELAEETGLITPITDWVLIQALAALRDGWFRRVSVNLSPRQLLDPGLSVRIERLLATSEVPAERLSLEVTETVIINNFDVARESLGRLRALGCAVGLDDFGTGYSSLGYLRRLPVDFLKLDRQLVEDIDTDRQARQIAEAVVSLAKTMSLRTVGEGVERQSQADALAAMACDFGQGWLFGRPRAL